MSCESECSRAGGLCDHCSVSPRGGGGSGCLVQTGESLGWPKGGGFGGCALACLGVSLQPGLTAGKVVSRVQCPLCRFLMYIAKNSPFDQAKNPGMTKSFQLGESAVAVLPSICSFFLFPSHSVVTAERGRVGARARAVIWVLLTHSS